MLLVLLLLLSFVVVIVVVVDVVVACDLHTPLAFLDRVDPKPLNPKFLNPKPHRPHLCIMQSLSPKPETTKSPKPEKLEPGAATKRRD